jgi:RCC1 and BTB domain-containing protein
VTGCLESKKVVFVASNGHHSACITEDGDTYTWGLGEHGQLGHGDEINRSTPKLISGLAGKKAKEVACGGYHTIVRTDNGNVYSFGNGTEGQLGHCSFENKLTPTLIQQAQLEGKCVVQVACGWTHTMVLTSEGRLYTWGSGRVGRLGHGSELKTCVPSVVESLLGYKVVHIASQNSHSVALVNSNPSLSMMMKAMVNDETCSDVVFLLKDGDERIHATKGLLIGRSEYFRAMFRSGMKESRENQVEVRDCSKAVFLLLLEYLYSGEVDIGMDHAIELYALSDRYQEDDLSRQCLEVVEIG